ncbi:hypothetical protein RYX36_005218, partial [Vicia faba]
RKKLNKFSHRYYLISVTMKSLFNRNPSSSSTASRSTSLFVHTRARLAGELEEEFKKFDINGDGKISASELGSIMGSLGQPASDEELNNMICEVDGDGDGCRKKLNKFSHRYYLISVTMKSLFNRNPSSSSTASRSTSLFVHTRARLAGELEEVFKKFDINGDGKISASELGSIMGSLGQPASDEELNNMICEVDGDGDGC